MSSRARPLWTAGGAGVFALGALVGAQQQQPPRFETGIELTRVEVTVLHKDTRKPIRGLTAEDFVVKVDGKVQRVATLAEVESPGPSAAPTAAFVEAAVDVTANDRPRPRVFVILMNDARGGNDPFTRQTGIAIGHRLIDSLGPEDMAAVVFTRDNRHAQDLTADRTLLRRAVQRFNPITTIGISPLGVLRQTQVFLAGMGRYRRAVMFVSPVMTGGTDRFSGSKWREADLVDPEITAVSATSRISYVPIFVFGTDGLLAPTADDISRYRGRNPIDQQFSELARTIASLTGGKAVVETNAPGTLVPAVFEELSSYYILAYENTYSLDGRHRWLQVDVKHPDAMVIRPRTLIAPGRTVARRRVVDRAEDSGLLEAIAAPMPVGDLPLRLSNVAVAVPGQREQAVALTLGLPAVALGAVEAFRVRLMLFDSEGRRELLTQTHDVRVPGREMRPGELNEMALRLDLRSGRYHLRIAAEQPSIGKAGSVHATLIVPDFEREPLSLSGVALLRPAGAPIGGREVLATLFPVAPTAVRRLQRIDRVTAVFRVHQPTRSSAQAVVLDTAILDTAGGEVHAATREIRADAFADGAGVEHRFDLPLATLEPGDYLLRFIASSGKNHVQRDVRFSVVHD